MHNRSLILASAIVLAQASLAQVRTSPDAFPLPPSGEALPVLPFTPAREPVLPEELSLVLQKGRPVVDGLRAYGQKTGWDLVWEAPTYVAERDMVVPGDFEAAVEFFLKGANEAGTRIRAVFYRGNKTVRVSEY
jgi:hypothetical protein